NVDVRTHLDLLDLDGPLLLARFGGLLLRLVFETAKIEDLADRRGGVRRDFDEVEAGFAGHGQGPLDGDNAEVGAFVVDQLDLADAYLLVYPRTFLGRWRCYIGSANESWLLRAVEERVVKDVRVWPPTWQKQFGQAAGEVNGAGADLIPGRQASRLAVGQGEAARELAVLSREGASPGVFWLGGFRSDMTGTKATAVDRFAAGRGLAATRFDYSGHGRSSGKFSDGTISRWLEEALAVFDRMTEGRQVVVGSSMGGWLALLLTEARHDSKRVAGLVLVAP